MTDFSVTYFKNMYICELGAMYKELLRKNNIRQNSEKGIIGEISHDILSKRSVPVRENKLIIRRDRRLNAAFDFAAHQIMIFGDPDAVVYNQKDIPIMPVENKFKHSKHQVGVVRECDHVQAGMYCWLLNENGGSASKYTIVTSTNRCASCSEQGKLEDYLSRATGSWGCNCETIEDDSCKMVAITFAYKRARTIAHIKNKLPVMLGYVPPVPTEEPRLCKSCDVKGMCQHISTKETESQVPLVA